MVTERSKAIGARMRQARKARGIQQKDAAKKFYCTGAYLGQMERGFRNVTDYAFNKAVEVYDVDTVWLRYGDGGMDDNVTDYAFDKVVKVYGVGGMDDD